MYPFNWNIFDGRTTSAKPVNQAPTKLPSQTAREILIRDGSNMSMRKQPDFESILLDMMKSKAIITLPTKTTFLGATITQTRELIAQHTLPTSALMGAIIDGPRCLC